MNRYGWLMSNIMNTTDHWDYMVKQANEAPQGAARFNFDNLNMDQIKSQSSVWLSEAMVVGERSRGDESGSGGEVVPGWVTNTINKTIPVAYSFELTGATEAVGASSASPWGGILTIRGPDAWNYKNFTSAGLGAGWVSASALAVGYKYYYFGDINNLKMDVFESWGNNISVSADVGFAVGLNISWVENPNVNGEYLIGVGVGAGVGVGPTIVSGQYTRQFNHIHW